MPVLQAFSSHGAKAPTRSQWLAYGKLPLASERREILARASQGDLRMFIALDSGLLAHTSANDTKPRHRASRGVAIKIRSVCEILRISVQP